jgi:hypothetical protein
MELIYRMIAYLGMPNRTAHDLMRTPTNPIYGGQIAVVTPTVSDVIPETVRRSAGTMTPVEGNYVIDRPPRNSGHRG